MHRIRFSVLSLFVYTIILFNIGRLDGGNNILNLDMSFFVLTVTVIVAILTFKYFAKLQQPVLMAFSVGVYFLAKLILITRHPIVGGIYTYLTLTELGLFILGVLLIQNLAINITDFERAVDAFVFADTHKIKPIQDASTEIQNEIYRSRRFHRPLSLVILEYNVNKDQVLYNKVLKDVQHSIVKRYTSLMLSREMVAQLRRTDLLLGVEKKNKLVIFSPDTNVMEAENFVNRLRLLSGSEKLALKFGVATFPDHALTFDDLLRHAEDNLLRPKGSQIRVDSHKTIGVD